MNVNNLASIHIQKCLPGSFGIQVGNCENRGFPWWLAQIVKNHACNARHQGSSPGSESSPGEGNGYPLQYSCLENLMDRGAWLATVQGITTSWTQLRNRTCMHYCLEGMEVDVSHLVFAGMDEG